MRLERLRQWRDRYMMHIALGAMIFGLLLVYFSPVIFVTIPPGHRGVMWHRFAGGTDLTEPLPEGTRVKLPWDVMYRYDARLQVVNQQVDAITKDGLAVKIDLAVRFRVNSPQLGTLHKNIGPDYLKVMLVPEIGSSARLLISRYTAEEFYTAYRLQVQDEIHKQIVQRLLTENSYSVANVTLIELDEVMIRSIVLPERVATAIERKIEQYQQNLEYDFRLVTEDKEARRKEIEGAGVRAMFDRIGPADVNNYLRLAGIQATLQLAASPNAKVVVVGNGGTAGGLPLLLGDINSSPAPAAAASAARQPGTRPLASLGSAAMRPLQIPVPAASEVPRAQTPTAAAPAVPAATRP